ncbi:MAG: SIMPL domain-containing protein [Candidatus Nomurabacteria bacterium]|nr:SIMPL domain-containing protein [Candidatus Nomurabacteria bacterium]
MENTKNAKNYGVLIIGLALLVFSAIFFLSAQSFSQQGSYVEVKGLSEKIVKADTAIWSINFEVKSNNVDSLYADIDKNVTTIKSFLTEKGFEAGEINVAPVNIYQDTYKDALFRYNSTTQLSVYTKKVDLVKSASKETLVLVRKGIVMNQNSISFEFSDINSIKPEMLAEALKNAKDTAQKIAQESGSSLGGLHRGNQGVFDITDKDPGSPEYKKIRLVSTVSFLIK